jgi:hypothetical protein
MFMVYCPWNHQTDRLLHHRTFTRVHTGRVLLPWEAFMRCMGTQQRSCFSFHGTISLAFFLNAVKIPVDANITWQVGIVLSSIASELMIKAQSWRESKYLSLKWSYTHTKNPPKNNNNRKTLVVVICPGLNKQKNSLLFSFNHLFIPSRKEHYWCVLVSSSFQNKVPPSEWLMQQEFIFTWLWRPVCELNILPH